MRKKIDKQIVYEYLRKIPRGKVVTYGTIAEYIESKKLARTIGNILHSNPDGDKYPCYKVVNASGKLSEQYLFGGLDAQKERLESEGIEVVDYRVDLDKYGWKDNN